LKTGYKLLCALCTQNIEKANVTVVHFKG